MAEPSMLDILAELKSQKEEIKEFVNSKVSGLRDEIQGASATATSELKKFKGQNEISWRSKGHKIQFNFNSEIQESLDSIKWAIDNGKVDYANEVIQEVSQKIKERNKHIRIADSSSGGWETVNQYVTNPVASDSDDESKIYKAENRALKKRKTDSRSGTKDAKSKPAATAPNPFSNYVASVPPVPYVPRAFLQGKQQTGTLPFRFGGCYVCGDFTHLQRECPLIIRTRSAPSSTGGQAEKKQSGV